VRKFSGAPIPYWRFDKKIRSHHEDPSTAGPQPKDSFYHEGHEEHEVKKFKNINVRNLRGLRVLRGEICFFIFGCGSTALC
jgi:hypothetical protein